MSQSSTLFIGMDVHKDTIAVAYIAQEHGAEVTYLGDFSKRKSLFIEQKLDGSEYPTWAMRDGVPTGSRSPAWLFCSV